MRTTLTLTFSAVTTALLLAALPAGAQDKPVQIKMSSWVPAQHPLNPALQAWADDIKKESNGTITAVLFPSEQLGKAFDAALLQHGAPARPVKAQPIRWMRRPVQEGKP